MGRFNVAPTQEVLTVRSSPDPEEAAQGEREARLMRWGLVPRWAKDLKVGYRMINAKAENLTSSRAYSPLVGKFRHRCLIVADGFYEWMVAEDPKQPRQPWRFTVDGGEPFAFAGICTRKEWEEEDRGFEDGWLYSCTIVTTTPNEVVAKVHDRMPAILPDARGRGGLAAARPRGRRRDRDVRAAAGVADVQRPRQPEAEQGRQRDRGAGAARRALAGQVLDAAGGAHGRLAVAGLDRAGDPRGGGARGTPERGEAQVEWLRRPARRQSPLPGLAADPVGSPLDDDAALVGEPIEGIAEVERGEVGAVRVEFDQGPFGHLLLDQLFAGARVGGAELGGLRDFGIARARIEQRTRPRPTAAPASILSRAATRKTR